MRRLFAAVCGLLAAGAAQAQYVPGYAPGVRPGLHNGFQFADASFPAVGSVADFDFKNARYSGPAITVSNASGGYVDDAAGDWTLVPPNTLRRSNKGVLIEGAQTNSIRNNSMQGAVAGTPGTLPTNWSLSKAGGITQQIVGTGTQNGMDYIDVRLSGTTTDTNLVGNIALEASAGYPTAASGQLWTQSAFLAIVAGSVPTGGSVKFVLDERSSGAHLTYNQGANLSITSALTRFNYSATLSNASTTLVAPFIWIGPSTSGVVVDITLRIGWPQLEQWSTSVTTVGGASSPIRTTGTAATRATDVVTFNASTFNGLQGTIAVVARPGNLVPSSALLAVLSNPANTLGQVQFRSRGQPNQGATALTSDTGAFFLSSGNFSEVVAGTRFAASGTWQTNDTAISSGGSILTSTTATTPQAGVNTGYVGSGLGGNPFNGYIERLAIYPYRAANSNLQTLSTLQNWGG